MTRPTQKSKSAIGYPLLLAIVFWAELHSAHLFFIHKELLNHEIVGVDGYWHLLRVEKIYETGQWYDSTLPRSNAPYGEKLHWTRPFDILLFVGAIIGSPILGFKEALYWWGVIINPILQLLALFVLVWAVKPLFDREQTSLVGYLFLFQPLVTFNHFAIGRPDHHGFTLFLFLFFFGCMLRVLLTPYNRKQCWATGAIAAVGVWVGVESIIMVLVSLSFLGLLWIWKEGDYGRKNLSLCLALASTSFVTMFIDDPVSQFLKVEFDRRSIAHLTLWWLITGFWLIATLLSGPPKQIVDRLKKRAIVFLGGVLAVVLTMGYIFPNFFRGPTWGVHPTVLSAYWAHQIEWRTLISPGDPSILYLLGITLAVLPFALYLCWKSRMQTRLIWAYITLLMVVYTGWALYQRRQVSYAEIIGIIPLAQLLALVLKWEGSFGRMVAQRIVRVFTVIIFCFAPFLVYFLLVFGFDADPQTRLIDIKPAFVTKLCLYLNDSKVFGNRPLRILANIYLGPELLYRTQHEVIGTPSHRNEDGIIDSFAIMNAEDDETAHRIINKRGINLIVTVPYDYSSDSALTNERLTFYERLRREMIPSWLEAVSVSPALAQDVKIFRVINY